MTATGGYLLGLDVGGTSTRAMVAGLDGSRISTGSAEGANPNSHPPAEAAARVGQAIRSALAGIDPADVRAGVLGIAGYTRFTEPPIREAFTESWRATGLSCALVAVPDGVAAFAAGTAEPDGTVLVAGTGSAGLRIEARQLARRVGGHGWLLGDQGSAYWLGREAVQAALAALDERQASELPDTPTILDAASTAGRTDWPGGPDGSTAAGFPDTVLDAAIGAAWRDVDSRQALQLLITAVHAEPPVRLAQFAPLVTAAAARGSVLAQNLVRRAVQHLAALVTATREAGERTPIVLTGGLLALGNPVGDGLRRYLDERRAGPVRTVADAVAGSVWLAGLTVLGDDPDAAKALHRKLID